MKKPFKVADKISIKGYIYWPQTGGFTLQTEQCPFTITSLSRGPGLIECVSTFGSMVQCHERQCRRLVKKKRRKVWINDNCKEIQGLDCTDCRHHVAANKDDKFVRGWSLYREVKKRQIEPA